MRLIYIAGKLNGDACSYIQNVHKMLQFGETVRNMGCCVAIPCNDFLHGLVIGTHEYEDYFDNNLEILKRADAIALVPGWETSEGTRKEILEARKNNIPVLYYFDEINDFIGVKP